MTPLSPRPLPPPATRGSDSARDTLQLSGLRHCPTAPAVSASARARALQNRALGESAALVGGGCAQASTAQVQAAFRQGLCPYLAQATQNAPGDWSALNLLRESLEQGQLDPLEFFQQVHEQYGPTLQVGDLVFESRPGVVQQILTATDGKKIERDFFSKSTLQIEAMGAVYGNESLFLLSDQNWQQRRELLQPFFTGARVLSEEKHAQILTTVREHMSRWPVGEPVDLGARLRELTLDVAVQHMFGEKLSATELQRAARLFEQAGERVTNGFLGRSNESQTDLQAELEAWADARLEGRVPGSGSSDMLQALVDAGHSRETLRQEVLTMAMLGHETTANLLSWTIAELAQHPATVDAMRQEYGAEIGNAAPSLQNTQDLGVVRSALKESTRVYPPNYLVSREATQDALIESEEGQLQVRPGMQILLPLQQVNHQVTPGSDEWSPDHEGNRFYSFGGGFRVCLGQVLARMESQVVLSQFVQQFDFQRCSPEALEPRSDFSTRPADMRFLLSRR